MFACNVAHASSIVQAFTGKGMKHVLELYIGYSNPITKYNLEKAPQVCLYVAMWGIILTVLYSQSLLSLVWVSLRASLFHLIMISKTAKQSMGTAATGHLKLFLILECAKSKAKSPKK